MNYKHSVLIVDDDPDDRDSIRDAFLYNKHHHNYVFLQSGDQLLNHLSSNNYDPLCSIILLDLNMPGRDGKDVLKEIKTTKIYQPIPVIVFTTSSSEKDRELSYELGANCFITKPDTYQGMLDITNSISRLWCVPYQ
jgi:CheY-like chemotaxis protein